MKPSAPASESHSIICPGCEEGELSSGGHRIGFAARCGHAPSRDVLERNRVKEIRSAKMICVTVEIREGALTHQARVTAPSIECALKIVSVGKPGRRVRLVFPIDPEAFFVPRDHDRSEELPPVSLYKGGGFSFVLDGRRHVSVASYHGVEWIGAHVTEFGATGLWSKRRERERLIEPSEKGAVNRSCTR